MTDSKSPKCPEELQMIINTIDSGLNAFRRSEIFRDYCHFGKNEEDLIIGLLKHVLYPKAIELYSQGKLHRIKSIDNGVIIENPNVEDIIKSFEKIKIIYR